MRLIIALLLLILFPAPDLVGQSEQEWIHVDQSYIRIPVATTGWYRITQTDLKNAGVIIDSLPLSSFQLFRRGQEVAIQVTGNANSLKAIEFYGEKNDGALDSSLYTSPALMPHPYYSLYSDTAAYFLTWNTAFSEGKRISQTILATADTGISYHYQKLLQVYTDEYPAGNLYPMGAGYDNGTALSTYDEGEGWTGKTLTTENGQLLQFSLPNRTSETSLPIKLNLLLAGRNAGRHQVEIWTGTTNKQQRKLGEALWLNYATQNFETDIYPQDLSNDSLTIWIKPIVPAEQVSVSYAELEYPQKINFPETNYQAIFNLEPPTSYAISSSPALSYFDITNSSNPRQLLLSANTNHQFEDTKKLLIVNKPLKPVGLKLVHFETINPKLVDYLIISHPSARKSETTTDPVEEYARYRSSAAGGNFKPLVINSDVIFDQFNYGEPGPLGIQNLIKWLSDKGDLRFVFLIGTSRDPQTVRKLSNARQLDQIPSMGWPGSDIALAMPHNNKTQPAPVVPVGRLFAFSPTDVSNYLEKVRQHEAQSTTASWRKKVLHISGGRSVSELNFFRDFIGQLKKKVDSTYLGVTVTSLSKQTDLPVESLPIAPLLNEGLSLITVIGHSGLGVTDVDLGKVSDPNYGYQNETKYPALIVNGCALGNYYYGPTTLSTDWISTPKKGGILFLAHTHNGLTNSMKRYTSAIYEVLTDPQYTNQAFGTIQKEAIRRFLSENYVLSDLITAQQMNLQGDPAIKLFPAQLPDYSWRNNTFTVTDEQGRLPYASSKQLTIKAELTNYGRYDNDSIAIQLRRTKNNSTVLESNFMYHAPVLSEVVSQTFSVENNNYGKELWELIIDPQQQTEEEAKTNNRAVRDIYITHSKVIPLLPVSGSRVAKNEIELVAQLPQYEPEQEVIFQWSKNADFTNFSTDTVTASGIAAFKALSLPEGDVQPYFWRVAIPGDNFSTSSTFTFRPDTISIDIPEGIAFLSTNSSLAQPASSQFNFQNVTNTRFSDSLEVHVVHYSPTTMERQKIKIPPIGPKATYSFQLPNVSNQTVGDYRILVNFNSNTLPEIDYNNNTIETTYQITSDQIPPILDVLVDNRRLTFNEAISTESLLAVRLSDENTALPLSDTSLVTIRILCSDCPKKLPLAKWEFKEPNTLLTYANLPNNLQPGTYNLIVTGKDRSGNIAAPYTIQFLIPERQLVTKAVAYPIPALEWVHFEVNLEADPVPEQWLITIFDTKGHLVKTLSQQLHTGKNDLYWFPSQLSSGIYYYRMEFLNRPTNWLDIANEQKSRQGKIIWKP